MGAVRVFPDVVDGLVVVIEVPAVDVVDVAVGVVVEAVPVPNIWVNPGEVADNDSGL
jgi:hypothetical protein